jgi:hypothetical protein
VILSTLCAVDYALPLALADRVAINRQREIQVESFGEELQPGERRLQTGSQDIARSSWCWGLTDFQRSSASAKMEQLVLV